MAELDPKLAVQTARTAIQYSQSFDDKGINWHSEEPWPRRIELAKALDLITELGAMMLNLADRVDHAAAPSLPEQAGATHWSDCAIHNEPAYPAGECDCGVKNGQQSRESELVNALKDLAWALEWHMNHNKGGPDDSERVRKAYALISSVESAKQGKTD